MVNVEVTPNIVNRKMLYEGMARGGGIEEQVGGSNISYCISRTKSSCKYFQKNVVEKSWKTRKKGEFDSMLSIQNSFSRGPGIRMLN